LLVGGVLPRWKCGWEGDAEPIQMKPGDFVHIPAHRKHRVQWTTPEEPTVWLAVFYQP
jgi:cupin 2 domain-containing protein